MIPRGCTVVHPSDEQLFCWKKDTQHTQRISNNNRDQAAVKKDTHIKSTQRQNSKNRHIQNKTNIYTTTQERENEPSPKKF